MWSATNCGIIKEMLDRRRHGSPGFGEITSRICALHRSDLEKNAFNGPTIAQIFQRNRCWFLHNTLMKWYFLLLENRGAWRLPCKPWWYLSCYFSRLSLFLAKNWQKDTAFKRCREPLIWAACLITASVSLSVSLSLSSSLLLCTHLDMIY